MDDAGWFADWRSMFIKRRMDDEAFYTGNMWAELKPLVPAESYSISLVVEAHAELARIIDDVQKNRNRPEELP